MTRLENLSSVSLEKFEAMAKDERFSYKLIDGVVMMSPRPTIAHQFISGNICREIGNTL